MTPKVTNPPTTIHNSYDIKIDPFPSKHWVNFRTISRILRIEGLIPFTGFAILIGFAVTLWEVGFSGANWSLFGIAAMAALLVHIDAHLWNDIMDLDVDRNEKSQETKRIRPLINGWATIADYKKMSGFIIILVLALVIFTTLNRPCMPFLFVLGFFFDYGYNHPRIALAYRPFTEWYIFPWLVVGVTMTVVYAATGTLSLLAFIISLLHGLTVTCFVVSMMRRDVRSDRLGGKITSSVLHPELPHSTIYGMVTLGVSLLLLYPLASILRNLELAYMLVFTTAIIAGINTVYGARIDQLCTRALHSIFPDFEEQAHKLMMRQWVLSLVLGGMIVILLTEGRLL